MNIALETRWEVATLETEDSLGIQVLQTMSLIHYDVL
jgi:hypothetical protein